RVEVLVDVREVHVRALAEVRRGQLDVAERLEVDDLPRAEALRLRRREAEEELGLVRDEVGARHACRRRHPLRQALGAVEATAGEALPDRGRVKDAEIV